LAATERLTLLSHNSLQLDSPFHAETTHDLSNQGLETSFKDLEAAGYEVRLADQPVLVETIKNWRTLVV